MDGYILTESGHDALRLFDENPNVRFAAKVLDPLGIESGFVATDDLTPTLRLHGTVIEPIDSGGLFPWPWRAAPKRAIATGREHFTLMQDEPELRAFLMEQTCVVGVALVSGGRLLVESDGPIAVNAAWTVRVAMCVDRRLNEQAGVLTDA